MPDLIGVLDHRNANVFLARVDIVEQAKINRSGRFRKEGKIYAVAQPRCAQRIRIAKPSLYRSHKRAAFLSDTERALAIANVTWRKSPNFRMPETQLGTARHSLRFRRSH